MAILHTVSRSTYQHTALSSCLRVAAPGSALLLIEDGVYAARASGDGAKVLDEALASVRIFALDADLRARGIEIAELIDGVNVVDYAGFVSLACEYDKVLAWF